MNEIVSPPRLMQPAHGLVSDANRPDVSDNRWENGISFTTRGCEVVYGFTWGCPAELKSEPQTCAPPSVFSPIVLETSLEWSTLDMAADPKSIVMDTLEFGTSSTLERILSNGINDVAGAITKTALSQSTSTGQIQGRLVGTGVPHPNFLALVPAPNAAAANAVQSVGTLEAKLLDASDHTGSAGTIFLSVLDAVKAYDLLVADEGKLYTKITGSQVIVGNFVPGVAYGVVGQVDLYLSDIEVRETVVRQTNTWLGQAERLAIVAFNTCAVFGQTV